MPVAAVSLCHSCTFARRVSGRAGQVYLLCRSEAVVAKYPQQPVARCAAYDPVTEAGPGHTARMEPRG